VLIDRDGIGLPTVHVEGDFAAPVTFGQTLRMAIELVRMGNTSMTFRFTGTTVGDEVVAYRGEGTMVAVRMSDFKPMRLPENYRAAIETLRPAP
jgi:4-hydroxybenzoyl-CoA thioesterase